MSCVRVAPYSGTPKGIVRLPATPVLSAPSLPSPPGDAEGVVGLAATWPERSAQSRSRAEEIVTNCRWPATICDTDTGAADYAATASRTTAREVDGRDRLKARACKLALTLLVRRLRRVPISA